MNFLSLEYFIVIAEEGNLSKAAERLYVSQQALSEHIRKLEEETNATLFLRSGGVSLTEAGRVFLKGAQEVLRARETLLRDLSEADKEDKGRFSVGFRQCSPPDELPSMLALFASSHPEYDCVVLPDEALARRRGNPGIDLYFSSLPPEEGMECVPLFEEKKYAVVASKTLLKKTYGDELPRLERRLAEEKDLSLLKDLPFAVHRPRKDREGPQKKADIFESAGFAPSIAFQSDSDDSNVSVCACGLAAYVGPYRHCRRRFESYLGKADSAMLIFPIVVSGASNTVAISYEKGKKLHEPERVFIEVAKEYFSEHQG